MNVLARVIDAGGEHRNALAEVEKGLFGSAESRGARTSQFWVLLVLASVIAAGGVVSDSTPAVIGAMIMTPLATPLYGVALAGVIGSRRHLRSALLLLLAGVAVSVVVGVLMALLTFERMPLGTNPQIVGRVAPTVLDLVIAIAAGLAGAFALVRRDVANILAGVAIAITLVPVLEVAGIALGSGRFDLAWGALLLFLTNAAAIMLGGVVVFTAAGYERAASRPATRRRPASLVATALIVALIIPLALTSVRSYRYLRWTSATESAAQEWAGDKGWRVTEVRRVGDEIVATVIGPGATPSLAAIKEEVRRSVRLIVSSGESVEL
jgi:uncharacterized hydrophobic protein (TIGR00271 family)